MTIVVKIRYLHETKKAYESVRLISRLEMTDYTNLRKKSEENQKKSEKITFNQKNQKKSENQQKSVKMTEMTGNHWKSGPL